MTAAVLVVVASIVALGFPNRLVDAFEVAATAITLVMVFSIQHTQGREQAATQRKLDELIRATPGQRLADDARRGFPGNHVGGRGHQREVKPD